MRREVVRAAVTAACLALAVLALPLAVALHLLLISEERGELERAALRAAAGVGSTFTTRDPVELPRTEPDAQLGVYDPTGHLRAGTGPGSADGAARAALHGQVGRGQLTGDLVVAVPVSSDERVVAVVRAASPMAVVWQRSMVAWAALLGCVTAALLAAVGAARRRARHLAAPLEALAEASRAIGDGDFSIKVSECGIPEIDRVAGTQNATARRLDQLLQRERQFTVNASHQLRTPLAGLQLALEAARSQSEVDRQGALQDALITVERLRNTIDDVLALHRQGSAATDLLAQDPLTLQHILDELHRRWHGRLATDGRRVTVAVPDALAATLLPARRVGQILDVLLDNAARHGAGRVDIHARPIGDVIAIDVTDEGAGIPTTSPDIFRRGSGAHHGIGLALAREFAESIGGRLLLARRTPPTFRLITPTHTDPGVPEEAEASSTASGEGATPRRRSDSSRSTGSQTDQLPTSAR